MGDLTGLTITSDETIPGLSDALERHPGASASRRIELLQSAASEQTIGAPADRGGPMWQAVVDVILRRRITQVLPPVEVPTDWIRFHVPPAGRGQLKLARAEAAEYGLKFKAVGCGWGSGKSTTLTVTRDFQQRTRCLRVALALQVRVTLYADGIPPRADVIGVGGLSVEELEVCPDCSGSSERSLSKMPVPAGEWIDLRKDPVGQAIQRTVELADPKDVSATIPFKLAAVGVEIGIDWSRRTQLTCDTQYFFPGNRRYRPMRSLNEPPDLPYWRSE